MAIPRPRVGVSTLVTALLALLAFAVSLVASPADSHAAGRRIDTQERAALRAINNYRAAHGLPRLRADRKLTRAAEWMSRDMGQNRRFGHVDSRGRNPFSRIASFGYPSRDTWRGENLAAGNVGGFRTFTQWKNSPAHNANLLSRNYRAIGIARVQVPGSPYGWYWTTTYGSRVTAGVR